MKKIVIKLGTSTLTSGTPALQRRAMLDAARQVAYLHDAGHQVVVISSGARAAGKEVVPSLTLDKSTASKQMFSAIGQVKLMQIWTELFELFDKHIGQILLTRGDFTNRAPYLNIRDTIDALLKHQVIPIVNENDPVATRESVVGDNDTLGALIANMIAADLYVIITDQKGLYDRDPRKDPDAKFISHVKAIDDTLVKSAKESSTEFGTGGMATKITAAELAMRSGTPTVITSFERTDLLNQLLKGEQIGTFFEPLTTPQESRKRWLLSEKTLGEVHVDEGAANQLIHKGASLLPVGVTTIVGEFSRGAPVAIHAENKLIGVGLTNYNSRDIEKIKQKKSDEIESLLSFTRGAEVIHRDDMVIL